MRFALKFDEGIIINGLHWFNMDMFMLVLCGACLNTRNSYNVTFYDPDFYDFLRLNSTSATKFLLANSHSLLLVALLLFFVWC